MEDGVTSYLDASQVAALEGDVPEALAKLHSAIFTCPDDPELHLARARAHALACDISSAVVHARKAAELDHDERVGAGAFLRTLLDAKALVLIDDGMCEQAYDLLSEALGLAQADDDTHRRLLLHRAVAALGAKRMSAAVKDADILLLHYPTWEEAHMLRATLALRVGDLGLVRHHVERALDLAPKHAHALELMKQLKASTETYEKEATKLLLLRHPEDAVRNLDAALALTPSDMRLTRRRAVAHKLAGNPHAALADLEEALALSKGQDPSVVRLLAFACNDVGVSEAQRGNVDTAARCFDRAISRDARIPRFLVNRGDLAFRQRQFTDAGKLYEKALQLCEEDHMSRLELEFAKLGKAWRASIGELGAGPQCKRLSREICGKLAAISDAWGTSAFNRGHLEEARDHFSEAIRRDPTTSLYRVHRAEVHCLRGDYAKGRADAEEALRIDPADSHAQRLRARLVPS